MTPLTTPIFWFSAGHKRSYDFASDSVASVDKREAQELEKIKKHEKGMMGAQAA